MIAEQVLPAKIEKYSWCDDQDQNLVLKEDAEIEEKIRHALWQDDVLRATDNDEIDIHVKNGVVYLSGHLLNSNNYQRVEKALLGIEDIRAIRNDFVMDDDLTSLVAVSLARLELDNQCKFFTGVSHGVVVLNGKVSTTSVRLDAELCAAAQPRVRGVINYIRVPGVALALEDSRFLQPPIGKEICFLDGISGIVSQVVINPNNRRVIAMTIRGRFYNIRPSLSVSMNWPAQAPEQFLLIPMSVMGNLTNDSGFLTIASTDYARIDKFTPSMFVSPNKNWIPPYPYCHADVLFAAEAEQALDLGLPINDSLGG